MLSIPKLLSDDECALVRRLAEPCEGIRPGVATGHAGQAKELRFPQLPVWLAERLHSALQLAASSFGLPAGIELHTKFQKCAPRVASYTVGTGFAWHADVHPGQRGQDGSNMDEKTWISCSVQLTPDSDYSGGDLAILPFTSRDVPPPALERHLKFASRELGSATLFPSLHVHQVAEVERGQRQALVAWGTIDRRS